MNSINICFSTGTGLISRIIRWITRAPVSHCCITFRDETLQKVMVMEASTRGFSLIPWSRWQQENHLVVRYSIARPSELQAAAIRTLAQHLGDQYDYIGVLAFLWRRIWASLRNPLASPTRLFCSESVALFLAAVDIQTERLADACTPGDIYMLCGTKTDLFTPTESVDSAKTE